MCSGLSNGAIVFEEGCLSMQYVIISNSTAAVGAVGAIRRNDKEAAL